MKILTLLRHAKSTWDDPVARDFDRPLNTRGRKAARTVGREMRAQNLVFDEVRASPAVRVIETIDDIGGAYGHALKPEYDQRIYLASVETLLEIIHGTGNGVERLLIVGHNPGLENLLLMLTRGSALRDEAAVKYPTATLAQIAFPIDRWSDVAEGGGTLERFIRPRDLDPDLGPDEDSY
jgi:phosphohistidine phosphatase